MTLTLSRLQCVVPTELSRAFTATEVQKMRDTFKFMDRNADGTIDRWELAKVLIDLGQHPSNATLDKIISEVDDNNDGRIDFKEFCYMHYMLKNHRCSTAFAATVKKAEKKFLTPEQVTSLRFKDGSAFQGQCTKGGVFEGHGTYEIGRDGSAYTGSFLHGRFHGRGHIWYENGDSFDGEFIDGYKGGSGTLAFNDGSSYVGSFEMGLMQGYGEYTCCTGDVYKGQFWNGKKHGKGKMFYRDGASFEGQWSGDVRQAGAGALAWPNGDTYIGMFDRGGLYHGEGILTRIEGDRYEGDFQGGVKEGSGTMDYATGDHYEGSWRKNVKCGQGTYSFADGNKYAGMWLNDRMEGDGDYFFSSGDFYRGQFLMDRPHGRGEATYVSNASTFTGDFRDGLPCGRGKMTYADGTQWEGTWKGGKREEEGAVV